MITIQHHRNDAARIKVNGQHVSTALLLPNGKWQAFEKDGSVPLSGG